MKRTLCSALACLMLLPTSALAVQATPSHQPIVRNGQEVSLAGYEIDGYTYFKLRDVAAILNGTENQFSVDYDGTGISLATGQPYTRVQGDLAPIPDGTTARTEPRALPFSRKSGLNLTTPQAKTSRWAIPTQSWSWKAG